MPKHGFLQVPGSPVVQETGVSVDGFDQTDSPQRWRPPLIPRCLCLGQAVRKFRAHVMEKKIGKRMDLQVAKKGQCRIGACPQCRHMAGGASDLRKEGLSPLDGIVADSAGRHCQCLSVKHQKSSSSEGFSTQTHQQLPDVDVPREFRSCSDNTRRATHCGLLFYRTAFARAMV